MAILISYGSYVHAQGELDVSVARQALLTDAETVYAERVQVTLNGTLVASTTTAMDLLFRALVTAYSTDGGDFVMTGGPTGAALSPSIYSSGTMGGVRVMRRPSMTDGRNAAYVTFLNYQIVLEAIVPASNPATLLRSFREQIRFSGGGKVYGTLETRTGKGHRQTWTQHAIYRAEQQGQAVGLYAVPTRPAPIWPKWLVEANPDILVGGGQRVGIGAGQKTMEFATSWRYLFESTEQLQGEPASWGEE